MRPRISIALSGVAAGLILASTGSLFAQTQRPKPRTVPFINRPDASAAVERDGARASRGSIKAEGAGEGQGARIHSRAVGSGTPLQRTSTRLAAPRYFGHCWVRPDVGFWGHRDLMAEIQWNSRQGFLPVVPVAEDAAELTGVSDFPAGWKTYGFVVPAGESLHVRLHHVSEGWFRLAMVNRWGTLSAGMLQNLIPTGNPEVKYTNPTKEAQAVYVVVDDPGWMSSKAYPFTLDVKRSWEPGKADTQGVKLVEGIWASNPVAGMSAEFARPRAGFGMSIGVGGRW